MINSDLKAKYEPSFTEDLFIKLMDIMDVNHHPHPYTIGPKHIQHASDHSGGLLGEDTVQKIPCAHLNCKLSYAEHTSDKVMFLQLKRNTTDKEMHEFMDNLSKTFVEDKIDGICFIETDEKFRITEDIEYAEIIEDSNEQ